MNKTTDAPKVSAVQSLHNDALNVARVAIEYATSDERRSAIVSVLRHGTKRPDIVIHSGYERQKRYLSVSFHSGTTDKYERARRLTQSEALDLLGFDWRKLGL